jgi:HEAT repeat protein
MRTLVTLGLVAFVVCGMGCGGNSSPNKGAQQDTSRTKDDAKDKTASTGDKAGSKDKKLPTLRPVADLLKDLKDPASDLRRKAAEELAKHGARAKEALGQLGEALNDQEHQVSVAAAAALARIGPDPETLAKMFEVLRKDQKELDDAVRRALESALHEITPDKASIDQLVEELKDHRDYVKRAATAALAKLGAEANKAVDQLTRNLRDANARVRADSAEALGKINTPDVHKALENLLQCLTDRDAAVVTKARETLTKVCEDAKTLPRLKLAFQDADVRVRSFAVEAIGKLGEPAVPVLGELLSDQRAQVRLEALKTLATMGPKAAKVDAEVRRLVKSKEEETNVRVQAMRVLENCPPEPANLDALMSAFRGSESEATTAAMRALVKFGKPSVHFLVEFGLKDVDEGNIIRAAKALQQIGPDAKDAVGELRMIATNEKEEENVREAARNALKKIDPSALEN